MACVVIIEDEQAIRQLLYEILVMEGYEVVVAGRPEDVDLRAPGKPNLFILDVMLQGTSGIDIAQALRAGDHGATPMVAVTASPAMARVARESELFQQVVEKPFDLEHMLAVVRRYARPDDSATARER